MGPGRYPPGAQEFFLGRRFIIWRESPAEIGVANGDRIFRIKLDQAKRICSALESVSKMQVAVEVKS